VIADGLPVKSTGRAMSWRLSFWCGDHSTIGKWR